MPNGHSRPWFEWIPGWMPICAAIFGAAMWIGQYTQGVNDRLRALEKAVEEIQAYIQSHDGKALTTPQPITKTDPVQDAGLPSAYQPN